MGHKKARSPA
ncbi:hypothetical protein YPPY46_2419, partial [Yersinia pestis PY-46]